MANERICLMTDSCSDITKETAEALGIRILCFPITVDGKPYREMQDFTKDEFYEMTERAREIPLTAQLPPFEILEAYEAAAKDGYTDLIFVTIGAGGSGTYQNAVNAKKQFEEAHAGEASPMRIHLVDGRNYTSTYGYAVEQAAKKLARSASVAELIDYLEDWCQHAGLYFVPMTLKYVKKSGRVSAAAAFAGELLGLKPFCRIVNCKSSVIQKIRGDQAIVPRFADYACEHMLPHTPYLVLTAKDPTHADELAALMTKRVGYPPEAICKIGPAIVCNAGTDVVGMVIRESMENEPA